MGTTITEPQQPSDEVLMHSLQKGDDSAMATLMERWELPVKAFLLRLGVPSEQVEDIAQDTFVRLYEKRSHFRVDSPFKPWILTLAGNLGRNAYRWKTRHPSASPEAQMRSVSELATQQDNPATAALQSERIATVQAAITGLPLPLRQAVLCVEMESMSYAQAAQTLNCTTKAVETRLYRAKQLLREALSKVSAS